MMDYDTDQRLSNRQTAQGYSAEDVLPTGPIGTCAIAAELVSARRPPVVASCSQTFRPGEAGTPSFYFSEVTLSAGTNLQLAAVRPTGIVKALICLRSYPGVWAVIRQRR
jgi:hypothetical protein